MNALLRYMLFAVLCISLGLAAGLWIANNQSRVGLSGPSSTSSSTNYHPEPETFFQALPVSGSEDIDAINFDDIYHQENVFDQLHFPYRISSISTFEQHVQYLESIIDHHDSLYSHNIANVLVERMVVIDPPAALEFIDAHRSDGQNAFISSIVTSWIRQDPEAAIDYFKAMKNKQLKYTIGARLLADPTLQQNGMMAEIEFELGTYSERIVEQVRMNRMPPANAFEEALLRSDHQRQEAMMRAIGRWYQNDPEAAMQRVAVLANQSERQQLMQVIMSMQSRQDPELALEMLAQYAPNDKNLMRMALMNYANQEPLLALSKVESWVSETGDYNIMNSLLSSWIKVDDVAALAYLETIPEDKRMEVTQAISFAYINQSPEAGMTWLMGLGPEYNHRIKRSAMHALSRFPDISEAWVDKLESEPELQSVLLLQVARRRGRASPEAALSWLEKYSESPNYVQARSSILQSWIHMDPEYVSSILENEQDNTNYVHLFSSAASRWASTDLDAALDWAESLPDSANKTAALSGLVTVVSDLDQALAIMDEMPDDIAGNFRLQLAQIHIQRDPEGRAEIAQKLELSESEEEAIRPR